MPPLVRKRAYASKTTLQAAPYASAAGQRGRISLVVPARNKGYLRTGGYYGRFRRRSNYAEKKFLDSTVVVVAGTMTGPLMIMDSIAKVSQGDTENNRIGKRITINQIQLFGRFSVEPSSTNSSAQRVRLLIIQDKQANGAQPATTDILALTPLTTPAITVDSFKNLSNSLRFRTLLDKTYLIKPQIAYQGANSVSEDVNIRWYKKCSIPMEYSGTSGAIANIRSNNVTVMVVPEDPSTTSLSLSFRIRYSD